MPNKRHSTISRGAAATTSGTLFRHSARPSASACIRCSARSMGPSPSHPLTRPHTCVRRCVCMRVVAPRYWFRFQFVFGPGSRCFFVLVFVFAFVCAFACAFVLSLRPPHPPQHLLSLSVRAPLFSVWLSFRWVAPPIKKFFTN